MVCFLLIRLTLKLTLNIRKTGLLRVAFVFILTDRISKATVFQLIYTVFCLLTELITLNICAVLISRDITV